MIFVTGGTGMLGAHLLYYLLNKNSKIIAVKRKNSHLKVVETVFNALSENPMADLKKIEWVVADINDYSSINKAMKSCKFVYHLAARVSFNPKDKFNMIANNVEGTANVVNAALNNKIEKFCHVSSISALGEEYEENKITEKSKRNSELKYSGYSESKYRSELEVWRGINEGLKAVIVNPSIILGIGDWNKSSAAMFSKVEKGFKFYTNGGNGFVDARDVCKCIIQLTDSSITNERFIINGENLAFREVFSLIADSLNKPRANIYINHFLSEIIWRLAALQSFIFNTTPTLTKETIQSAHGVKAYSNSKVKKAINVNFTSIKETILFMSLFFQKNTKT